MSVANSVNLIGRITKDPEVRGDSGSSMVARMCMAVKRDFKDSDGNYGSDFINVVAFGSTASFLEKFFHKGDAIAIQGRIQTGSYTNRDGVKVYTTDVIADKADFLPGSKNGSSNDGSSSAPQRSTKNSDQDDGDFMNIDVDTHDDLPF